MKNKNIKILIGIFFILGVSIVFNVDSASASIWDLVWQNTGEQETVEFLQRYQDYLSYGDLLSSIGHWLGWLVIKGLFKMTSFLERLIPESLNLLDFLDDAGLQGIVKAVINDLVVVLMVLVLVYLGLKTVVAKNPPNFKSVGVNIFISAFLILGMPALMNTMQDISLEFYDATQTGENNEQVSSLAWSLIQDNTADLVYVSSRGFSTLEDPSSVKNALTPETFKATNLNSLITPETIRNVEGTEIENLEYRLDTNENGEIVADKIKDSSFGFLSDFLDQGYFRYQTKFIPMIVGLAALAVAYVFTVFVFITTIIEIGFKRVVGLFVFATDLESGQRTKMVVQDIGNAFMLIAFTGLSLKMYTLFLSFLATSNVNAIIYVVALVSATFVLIKGSNTIMRYFGVDVGLKEGFGQIAGAFALGRGTANMARGMKNLGKKVTSKGEKSEPSDQTESNANPMDNQNLNNDGRLKKSINSAGKTFGYVRNRGMGGMAEDAVKGTGEKMTGGIKNNVNSMKDQWNEGLDQGTMKGEMNREKWSSRKAGNQNVNDVNTQNTLGNSDEMKETNNMKDRQSTTRENPSINDQESSQNENATTQSNEEVLRKMKLEDAMNPGNMDTTGNVKMKADMEGSGEIKQTVSESMSGDKGINEVATTKEMDIAGNVDMNSSNTGESIDQRVNTINDQGQSSLQNATQKVDQVQSNTSTAGTTQPSVQKIMQQVEKTSFANPEKAKQSIIQEVQKGSFGSNDIKQRVVQEIEKSSTATPQQLQQNVQQVFSKTGVPNEVQNSIQKVIQEVQSSGSYQPQNVKAKVIEEIEKAPMDNPSLKQNVIQEVEKAFKATPMQEKQNIKQNIEQVIETTENQNIKSTMQQEVKEKASKQSQKYFDSLLPDDLKIEPITRKGNRFKRFKK